MCIYIYLYTVISAPKHLAFVVRMWHWGYSSIHSKLSMFMVKSVVIHINLHGIFFTINQT